LFLDEGISIPQLEIRSNEGAKWSCYISLNLPGGKSQNSDPTAGSLSASWEFLTNFILLPSEQQIRNFMLASNLRKNA